MLDIFAHLVGGQRHRMLYRPWQMPATLPQMRYNQPARASIALVASRPGTAAGPVLWLDALADVVSGMVAALSSR